jgi:Protein of unknown function (DUF3052)
MERVYTTPRLDKLGIKPGMRVALVDLEDEAFETELRARTHDVTQGEPLADTHVVLYAADTPDALGRLATLRERLVPNGAIWVVSRKGRAATIRDVDVIDAARAAALVDNKVASFDDSRTALRLVIPLALRPRR